MCHLFNLQYWLFYLSNFYFLIQKEKGKNNPELIHCWKIKYKNAREFVSIFHSDMDANTVTIL